MLLVNGSRILQKIGIVGHLALGPGRPSNDDPVVYPLVLLMACFNLDMQMEPVPARIDRGPLP